VRLGDTGNRSVTKVSGLIGLPGIRGAPYDRPEQDGGVEPYAQFLSARTVSVEGECWAATIPLAFTDFGIVAQALEGMVTTEALLKWRPAGDTRDLQMTGKLIGDLLPVLDADDQGPFLRYLAQFRCADPRAYSQTLQSASTGAPTAGGGIPTPIPTPIPVGAGATGGSLSALNNGNTMSWPTLTLAGPINGPVIVVGSSSLYFAGLALAVGQTLTIVTNPVGRSAKVAGASVIGALRFAESVFAGLPPKVATPVSFYSLGGGTDLVNTNLTVAWRDAWTA
jgi:hypothetical protein